MDKKQAEMLYSLNQLIWSLQECGWDKQAETLKKTRDEIWADPEDSTPDHVFTELTYLPFIGLFNEN